MASKTRGIVRKIDELGRIVIPIELRKTLGFGEREELEIVADGARVVIRKPGPTCEHCNGTGRATRQKAVVA